MFSKLTLPVFIFFLLLSASSQANDTLAPWDFSRQEQGVIPGKEPYLPAVILKDAVLAFSKYISPVDGDRCPMYPTCAAYGREAIDKHGFALGLLMTVDRLIHEGNEMGKAPRIKVYDTWRFLDPVSNNDFWWR